MRSAGDQLTHYRLVEPVGDTHREVWRAVDTKDDRAVSIKILPHLAEPAALDRLRRDADALASIGHPGTRSNRPRQHARRRRRSRSRRPSSTVASRTTVDCG